MNLKALFSSGLFLIIIATTGYSQNDAISISAKGKSIKEIFEILESESNYHFFYSDDFLTVNKTIDIEIQNGSINQILDKLFGSTEFGYKIMDNNMIVVTLKKTLRQHDVIGYITNEKGLPISGVSVLLKRIINGHIY